MQNNTFGSSISLVCSDLLVLEVIMLGYTCSWGALACAFYWIPATISAFRT